MGYAHGTKWTEELIEKEIFRAMEILKIKRMPSPSEVYEATGDSKLGNKIAKTGGYRKWAHKLNLSMKDSESRTGIENEFNLKYHLEKMGYKVDKMPTNHPYDLLINNSIKVDVKASKSYNNGNNYSFKIGGKNYHTCDIFICIGLDDNDKPTRYYIVPSNLVPKLTQIVVSVNGKYKKYEDKWDYIDKFLNFYNSL